MKQYLILFAVLLPIICSRLIHDKLKTKNEPSYFLIVENYAKQLEILPLENIGIKVISLELFPFKLSRVLERERSQMVWNENHFVFS